VRLDHCRDLAEMQRCLDAGYSTVMIDGSHLSFHDNIELTRKATALARSAGAWIEAEWAVDRLHRGIAEHLGSPHTRRNLMGE
jgi:fructose/tagatose bisphosphate aldolase